MAQFIPLAIMAAGSLLQARSQKDASDFNVAVAQRESKFQRQKTDFDLFRHEEASRARQGSQIAEMAARGTFGTESGINFLAEQKRQDELDAIIIRFGGEVGAQRSEIEAIQEKKKGRSQPLGTLLTGASNIAGAIK